MAIDHEVNGTLESWLTHLKLMALAYLDNRVFPLKTPVVLMTSRGYPLGAVKGMPLFVEFEKVEGGVLVMRSADEPDKYLCRKYKSPPDCCFGDRSGRLLFETKKTCDENEWMVFQEYNTKNWLALDESYRKCICGGVTSNYQFYWFVAKPFQLSKSSIVPPATLLQNLAAASEVDPAARRQLIMHFSEAGNSSDEIAQILNLLYGSTAPLVEAKQGQATEAERRKQILTLVKLNKSTQEVGEVIKAMYGTTQTCFRGARACAFYQDDRRREQPEGRRPVLFRQSVTKENSVCTSRYYMFLAQAWQID